MPAGLPSPESLTARRVGAFSLDTSIIEAAGFRFDSGALRHLGAQLPPWLKLWMSEIVLKEVTLHRHASFDQSILQVRNALTELRRQLGDSSTLTDPSWLPDVKTLGVHSFDKKLQDFIASHNGQVLDAEQPSLAALMFDRYFRGLPPFATSKDKKAEFPDAAVLLGLDMLADKLGLEVVTVSRDKGWMDYAEKSRNVFCVDSLQALASLFVSDTAEARAVAKRVRMELAAPSPALRIQLRETLQRNLMNVDWKIQLGRNWADVDIAVADCRLKSFVVNPDAVGVWVTSQSSDACVAEIEVDVDVSLLVEAITYFLDYEGHKQDIERKTELVECEVPIKVVLEMVEPLRNASFGDIVSKMDLADQSVAVSISHTDLAAHLRSRRPMNFDDFEDDIPF